MLCIGALISFTRLRHFVNVHGWCKGYCHGLLDEMRENIWGDPLHRFVSDFMFYFFFVAVIVGIYFPGLIYRKCKALPPESAILNKLNLTRTKCVGQNVVWNYGLLVNNPPSRKTSAVEALGMTGVWTVTKFSKVPPSERFLSLKVLQSLATRVCTFMCVKLHIDNKNSDLFWPLITTDGLQLFVSSAVAFLFRSLLGLDIAGSERYSSSQRVCD